VPEEPTFACYVCGERFPFPRLVAHLRTHTDTESLAAARRNKAARPKTTPETPD
jgi:hypothetical protein